MKSALILFWAIVLSLCFTMNVFAEGEITTEQIYSDNREYAIEITGWAYDGFGGECLYEFYDRQKHQYWQKRYLYDGDPAISNRGDTAIPQSDTILFYDKYGKLKGKATVSGVFYFDECLAECITHQYSWDGSYYYLVTRNLQDNSVRLWCFDHEGIKLWEIPFPPEVFSIIRTTSERILFVGQQTGGQYKETTYLLDSHSGEILMTFSETQSYPSPLFLQNGEVFVLQKSDRYMLYDSKNGKPIEELPIEKVYPLLHDATPLHILFALQYLGGQVKYAHLTLSEEIVEQLKRLQKADTYSFGENDSILVYREFLFDELGIEDVYYHDAMPYTGTLRYDYLNGNIAAEYTYQNGHLGQVTAYWHDSKGVKASEYCADRTICKISQRKWSEAGELVHEEFLNDKGNRVERVRDAHGEWFETTYP